MSDQENKSELKETAGSCCCSVPLNMSIECPPQIWRFEKHQTKITYYKEKNRKNPREKRYLYSKIKSK